MMLGGPTARALSLVVLHAVHVLVLLLPTLVLAGAQGVSGGTFWFACAITLAAILECLALPQPTRVTSVHDRLALRVALFVGLCLLLFFWLAQIERILYQTNCFPFQISKKPIRY